MKLLDMFTRWRAQDSQEADQATELAQTPQGKGKPRLQLIVAADRSPAYAPRHGRKPHLYVIEGGVAVRARWPAPTARAG